MIIEFRTMIETHLPAGLKRVSIFEDYNENYIPLCRRAMLLQDPVRIIQPRVGAALAHRSLDLEQLSASFMVDAVHFTQARQEPCIKKASALYTIPHSTLHDRIFFLLNAINLQPLL
jgi:hypothetical protein